MQILKYLFDNLELKIMKTFLQYPIYLKQMKF